MKAAAAPARRGRYDIVARRANRPLLPALLLLLEIAHRLLAGTQHIHLGWRFALGGERSCIMLCCCALKTTASRK